MKEEYGRVDSEFGPFSIQSYLHWMAKPREFGDIIMIKLIASLWACRITVVRSDSLAEFRFRHYSPAICVKEGKAETLEIVEKFIRGKHYDPDVDREERRALKLWRWKEGSNYKDLVSSESDEEALKGAGEEARRKKKGEKRRSEPRGSEDVLEEQRKMIEDLKKKVEGLEKKCQVVEKIKKLVGGASGEGLEEDNGDGDDGGVVKKRKGFEAAAEVQQVQKGDIVCKVCCKGCLSTRNLKRHIEQFHKREYRYYCQRCNRGFMKKVGICSPFGNTQKG